MEDQKQIMKELKEVKDLLAKLIGTSELSAKEKFSQEAVEKAAAEFKKMSIERGEWIEDYDINKYIKKAPYRAGKFIRLEFGFTSFFKKGSHQYYYYKNDLIALGQELKEKNIDLGRYIELKEDQLKFEKYAATVLEGNTNKGKGKRYKIPEGIKDIVTSFDKKPSPDAVRAELKKLHAEFFEHKMGEYIDIYDGNYAMVKRIYMFQKYIDPEIKRRIKRWTENFNMANRVLKLLSKKKEEFIPVAETEMIRL